MNRAQDYFGVLCSHLAVAKSLRNGLLLQTVLDLLAFEETCALKQDEPVILYAENETLCSIIYAMSVCIFIGVLQPMWCSSLYSTCIFCGLKLV
jgi:hypothetical protein